MIILGILDSVAALILIVQVFSPLSLAALALIFGLYLAIKAIFFAVEYSFDIAGAIDLLAALLLFISMFFVLSKAVLVIVALLLIFKGIRSIFA